VSTKWSNASRLLSLESTSLKVTGEIITGKPHSAMLLFRKH